MLQHLDVIILFLELGRHKLHIAEVTTSIQDRSDAMTATFGLARHGTCGIMIICYSEQAVAVLLNGVCEVCGVNQSVLPVSFDSAALLPGSLCVVM